MKPNLKYAVIHRHCERYPIKEMCCFFEVSRSGYYKYLKHIEHPAKDFKLAEKIRAKQETCRRTYGYRRMKLWLDSEGIAKNPKTVLRIMHKYGLLSEVRRRKKWQKMGDDKHRYDNLLNREFNADYPNQKWVTDISYIQTKEGVLYLSMIRDLYDRSIVAYKTDTSQPDSQSCIGNHSSCDEVCKNKKSPGVAAPQRPGVPIHFASIFQPD